MVDINKDYCLDLKAILKFINYSDVHTNKETEIVDKYEKNENKDLSACEKTIREITTGGNQQMDNISYDLLKILLAQVLSYGYNEEAEMATPPLGFEIAFNTLINEKFLIEK